MSVAEKMVHVRRRLSGFDFQPRLIGTIFALICSDTSTLGLSWTHFESLSSAFRAGERIGSLPVSIQACFAQILSEKLLALRFPGRAKGWLNR